VPGHGQHQADAREDGEAGDQPQPRAVLNENRANEHPDDRAGQQTEHPNRDRLPHEASLVCLDDAPGAKALVLVQGRASSDLYLPLVGRSDGALLMRYRFAT